MSVTSLANPLAKIIGSVGSVDKRKPQQKGARSLPAGIRIVSADSHFEVAKDIFFERFPAHMIDKAPRVTFDGSPVFGAPAVIPDNPNDRAIAAALTKLRASAVGVGAWDMSVRDRDLDIEGIEKDLMFPHSMLAFIRYPDLELQEWIYRTYNEYLAEVCRHNPKRYYGVGICSNWWDPNKVHDAIRQIVDLGFKTFLVPTLNAGKTKDGRLLSYGGVEMDAFWCEVAAAGLPICFHTGEGISIGTRGAQGATMLEAFAPFRRPFGQLYFGGVFDRHPNIKVMFAEGGISWVPPTLQDAEYLLDVHRTSLDYIPNRRPTDCWHEQCYASFMNDPLGLSQIQYIGVGNALWSSDYPHNEGTLGFGWDSIMAVINTVGAQDAEKILGRNAVDLFHLDE